MPKQTLDFLVIGAMRSGTTTLHELLKQHPAIYLPLGKEVPFFADETAYAAGIDAYLASNFGKADPAQQWGTISPSYMFNLSGIPTSEVAERIKTHNPDIKIVAILRQPIERAYSHYQFARRNGFTEVPTFTEAVEPLLTLTDDQQTAGQTEHPTTYLTRSRYGACLHPYYDRFPADNIMVIFTDELEARPVDTIRAIFRFIGVDDSFVPDNTGKTFHKGGSQARISWLSPGVLVKHKLLRAVVRRVLPYHVRKRLEMWLLVWNTRPDNSTMAIDAKLHARLVEYFADDIEQLEALSSRHVPWREWR